ncbi:MAG: penicillin-binding protein 1C [Candidatus Hydrogenedentes bacterium]|nr:penicillin-binding protein 1C [Candidatus Hydrogenedentota bacterium]
MRGTGYIVRLVKAAWRSRRWAFAGGATACVVVTIGLLWPMDAQHYLSVGASSQVFDRNGKLLYAFLNDEEQWQFSRPLAEISPYLVQATIAAEDQRFREHAGVDFVAIGRAVLQNVTRAHIHSGASTLTMQIVKQADDLARSLPNKAMQAWRALRLERNASKDAILEAYLNSAPYGLNLVGCESAARRYYGKPSSELTLSEAATLAALPKSPVRLMPLKRADAALARRDYVLDRMADEGFISIDDRDRAKAQALGVTWNEFPQLAPHLAMRLAANMQHGDVVSTTIDLALQERTERALSESLKQFDNEVSNAAAIIVDAGTAQVLARVGSADFYGTPGGGQVDACRAPRSPGSALKPFTYALGIERNVLYAGEMLLDDSLDYGLYNPENYDGKYRGLVSATYALRRSLNVPAVTVLDRLGYDDLHRLLTNSGMTTLVKPAEFYGLGLTLGNCEIRLDQLTAAYCMLANLGEYRSLQDAIDQPQQSKRVLSEGTCLSLYTMLEQEFPSEFQRDVVRATGYLPRVCWKTGTSTGNHDAWAFVFNRQYVVGVWLGNNDAKASKFLVGARAALPLAARIFRALPHKSTPDWPDFGDAMRTVKLCADTGLPATQWCPHTATELLPASQFTNRRCDVHYPLAREEDGVTQRWPVSAKGWDLAKVTATENVISGDASRKEGLRIIAPSNNSEFVLASEPNADRIRLRSSVDASTEVHWYLDGQYIGFTGPANRLFIDLREGSHQLTCMASSGSIDSVTFSVDTPRADVTFRSASLN